MSIVIHSTSGAVVLALFGLAPQVASGQIDCGTPSVAHSMRQTPNYQRSVDVSATTSRPIISCPLQVRTEAWVDALSTSFVNSSTQVYSATVSFTRAVPYYGTWSSTAKHWLIFMLSGVWQNLGNTYRSTRVVQSSSGSTCMLTASDCPEGYEFKPSMCLCVTLSPILIDTAGNGYRLTSADEGVVFDLDANGTVAEKVAWTEPDGDDAWLVLDRNGNGSIDSGAELFGSRTPAYADSSTPITENGFDALELLEGPTYGRSQPDQIIDARDEIYARLRLWFDRNHNGVSEADELVPLADAGVLAISSEYKQNARRDEHGNKFSLMGKALFRGPEGQQVWRNIYDVYLTVAGPTTR
jgi:hypothetical protein